MPPRSKPIPAPTSPLRHLGLRLDPEHYAALERVAKAEHLSRLNTLRRLIRLADQGISGEQSPFRGLEFLSQKKAG